MPVMKGWTTSPALVQPAAQNFFIKNQMMLNTAIFGIN